jgi:hypothetical protein
VFMDVAAIAPGEDFVAAVEKELASCCAVVAVIGPEWLEASDASGRRRLDHAEDLVRIELAAALGRPDLPVFPVLVADAPMPPEAALPGPLKKLARRNAIELSDSRWPYDCHVLVQQIDRAIERDVVSTPEEQAPASDAFELIQRAERAWALLPHQQAPGSEDLFPLVSRVGLEIGPDLEAALVADPERGKLHPEFLGAIERHRQALRERFGVEAPGVRVRAGAAEIAGHYIVTINEVPLVSGRSPASEVAQGVAHHLADVMRKNLAEFVGVQEMHDLLLAHAPDAAPAILEAGGLPTFVRLVRMLLEEEVPARPLSQIAEVFLDEWRSGGDVIEALSRVRLLPEFVGALPGNRSDALLFEWAEGPLKRMLTESISRSSGSFLALRPDEQRRLLDALCEAVGDDSRHAIVLPDGLTRRAVRKLIELDRPQVAVLAEAELLPVLRRRRRRHIGAAA